MNSNTNTVYGQLVTKTTSYEWAPPEYVGYPRSSSGGDVQNKIRSYRSLAAAVQGTGNRKDPVPQSYLVEGATSWTGSMMKIMTSGPGSAGFYNTSSEEGPTGTFLGTGSFIGTEIAYNKAVSKLGEKARGGLDLSVSAFEISQTRQMVNSAVRLESYIKDFNRKHRGIANKYLEFIFGWKPLVQDLFSVCEEIAKVAPSVQKVKARGTDKQITTSRYVENGFFGLFVTDTISSRVELGGYFRPSDSLVNQIAKYTSLNPASIAWEVTPFSFLVDYVVDVGGWLRNVENSLLYAGGQFSGYETTTQRAESAGERKGLGRPRFDFEFDYYVGTQKSTSIRMRKTRNFLNGWPFPVRPQFNVSLGSTRLLNVAALLTQLLPKPARALTNAMAARKRSLSSQRVIRRRLTRQLNRKRSTTVR